MKSTLALINCAATLLLASCNSHDAVDNAQKVNEIKTDSAATSAASPAMGDVKKDALNYDSEFLTKAASGGMLEVQLGQQVAARATTPEAKKFAQQMITDHQKANAELKALAARKNITLPAALGEDHASVMRKVLEEKGGDLDQQYLKEMLEDHEEDVKEYTDASVKAADPDIKAFAAKNIPVLRMHRDMALAMRAAVTGRK